MTSRLKSWAFVARGRPRSTKARAGSRVVVLIETSSRVLASIPGGTVPRVAGRRDRRQVFVWPEYGPRRHRCHECGTKRRRGSDEERTECKSGPPDEFRTAGAVYLHRSLPFLNPHN